MRRDLWIALALLALCGAGWLGWRVLFSDDGGTFAVVEVRGDVRHVDGLGGQKAAVPGVVLGARDRLVARSDGTAVLGFGEGGRVTLEPSSAIEVVSVDPQGVKIELEGGKVHATVRPGSGSVGIRADGREARATDADFTAVRDTEGTFGVVAERGVVALEGAPGQAELRAGERVVLPKGGSPLRAPADEALLLYVVTPASTRTREANTKVRGKTQPAARVRVGAGGAWSEVKADAAGEWTASVALAEGENDVVVEATDVFGRAARSTVQVVRDTTAPAVGVEITY